MPIPDLFTFYDDSEVLDWRFAQFRDRGEIAACLRFRLSNRCKNISATVQTCRFASGYYEFALSRPPALPYDGDSAISCLSRRLLVLLKRCMVAPDKGRYFLKVRGEEFAIVYSTSRVSASATTKRCQTKCRRKHPPLQGRL